MCLQVIPFQLYKLFTTTHLTYNSSFLLITGVNVYYVFVVNDRVIYGFTFPVYYYQDHVLSLLIEVRECHIFLKLLVCFFRG